MFNFIRNAKAYNISFAVSYNDENISLTGKNGFVLTNDPCRLVLENRIFQFDDIDGKKLLPFFKKKSISIRQETEKKFLETFAKTSDSEVQGTCHRFYHNRPAPKAQTGAVT